MAMAKSIEAYADCLRVLDQALSMNGCKVKLATEAECFNLARRLNTARVRYRYQSKTTHEPSDPLYGKSPWDGLRISRDGVYVKITPFEEITYDVEPL